MTDKVKKAIVQLERISNSLASIGETVDYTDIAIQALEQTRWIPVSERLPKENEYIGNVCKYYLIQDEYGDMHVAHLSNVGWRPMDSLKTIGAEVIAWRELPERYAENKTEQTLAYADQDTLQPAT